MELNNDQYVLKVELLPQTPMAHFQYDQLGAVLRASEVKPRLDKFLEKKIAKLNYSKDNLNSWRIPGSDAFDYKMRIYADGKEDEMIEIKNMDNKAEEIEKSGIDKLCWGSADNIISRSCIIKIICFHSKLLTLIEEYIDEFFITYNFGSLQNKGFGSFVTNKSKLYNCNEKLSDRQIEQIGRILKNNYDVTNYYYAKVNDFFDAFDFIHKFYSKMKSGKVDKQGNAKKDVMNLRIFVDNALENTDYLDEYDVIKRLVNNENVLEKSMKFYIGVLLGMSNYIECEKDNDDSHGLYQFEITNDKIQRYKSPIYFKYIKGVVFILARNTFNQLKEQTQTFTFTFMGVKDSTKDKLKIDPFELSIPEGIHFNIDDFIEQYVNNFNNREREKSEKSDEYIKYNVQKGAKK